jgi:hypothetical protein
MKVSLPSALTGSDWLRQHLGQHVGSDVQLADVDLLDFLGNRSLPTEVIDDRLHQGLIERGEDAPEESALRLVVAIPAIRHVPKKLWAALDRQRPHQLDLELWPSWHSEGLDLLFVEDELPLRQDTLHEVELAILLLRQVVLLKIESEPKQIYLQAPGPCGRTCQTGRQEGN